MNEGALKSPPDLNQVQDYPHQSKSASNMLIETLGRDLRVRHILPKPNQIVKTAQQIIKTIYPYDMIPSQPSKFYQQQIIQSKYYGKNKNNNATLNFSSFQSHFKYENIIYDRFRNIQHGKSFTYNIYSVQKLKSFSKQDYVPTLQKQTPFVKKDSCLIFDSCFQNGNLNIVAFSSQCYCLLLSNDINTSGYTNWFYFSVQSTKKVKANLAIMNFGKASKPFNTWPGISVWRSKQKKWQRKNCQSISMPNVSIYLNCGQYANFNTLYFQYEFDPDDKVFFAYNPPFTYTNLLNSLDEIQKKKQSHFHRKIVGTSLLGNRLQLITISNFNRKIQNYNPPVVIFLGRSHPGQTVSSWIIHQIIKFLISDSQQAFLLRQYFIFKIFPMINPDGVIHGNYRCSVIGRDLNRRWKNPTRQLYPEVYYIKSNIKDLSQKKNIKLIIDFHGHTQKINSFFYGCGDKLVPHKARLFPFVVSKMSNIFQFSSCNFAMDKSKQSTARITLYNLLKNTEVLTLQTSQFGLNDNFLSSRSFKQIGLSLCKAIFKFYKKPSIVTINNKQSQNNQNNNEIQKWQQQIINNPNLLKIGCDIEDGSDSQPSVCNLQFQKINKMAFHMIKRPLTQLSDRSKKIPPRPQSHRKNIIYRKQMSDIPYGLSKQIIQQSTPLKQKLYQKPIRVHISRQQSRQIRQSKGFNRDNEIPQKIPVKMINFQLLIQQSGSRKSSIKQYYDGWQNKSKNLVLKRNIFRNRSYNNKKNSM